MARLSSSMGLLLLIAVSLGAQDDGNLIEYSYGGFASGMETLGPMLLPPVVKIYTDGRIVFADDDGVWEGRIDSRRLDRLKADLAKNPLLGETAVIPVKRGASPGYHGGMAYIRYLSGDREVVIGAFRLPTSGRWARLVRQIRSHIPSTYRSFAPEALTVRVSPGRTWEEPVPWPFSDTVRLSATGERPELEISDRRVTRFLLEHGRGGFSWLEVAVSEGSMPYRLQIIEVPGWYEPIPIEITLGSLVALEREKARQPGDQ